MGVNTTNLIMGPGTLYRGAFGAAEPTDEAIDEAPDAAVWTDVGGTRDGVSLTFVQEYTPLEVDQIVDVVGRRLTRREFQIQTNLAEPTLENLAYALNETGPTAGTGVSTLSPTNNSSATQPNYSALIFDGYAPSSRRRRVIGRRMLSTNNVEFAYSKSDQTVFTVRFDGHFVSASIPPFVIIDEAAA